MKKGILLVLCILFLMSCGKNDLKSEFDCGSSTLNAEMKEYRDVLKKFRVAVPLHWKTQLYYDEFQSQLYSADTTKSINEAYIVDISWHQGELALDQYFDQTVKDTLAIKEQLSYLKSSLSKFQDRPSYWNLSKGKTGKHDYHFLQVYVKTAPDEYFTMSTKVIGNQDVEQRLCNAIALYQGMEFIE